MLIASSLYPCVAVACLGLAYLPSAYAWGAAGHEIIATIAQIHLEPDVLPVLCDILDPPSNPSSQDPNDSAHLSASRPPCHLAPIAAWADKVRRTPGYGNTAPLHYVGALDDSPSSSCVFPGSRGWAGRRDNNVLAAVTNKTRALFGALGSDAEEAAEALKFLVHFVGDMHMPLHLTGKERGGNGARVTFDGRVTNLHTVWDSLLIAHALRIVPSNYTLPLEDAAGVEVHLRGAIYDPYVRRIMHEGFGAGVGPSEGAGRFEDDRWLSCPTEEERAAARRAKRSAVWDVIVSMLRFIRGWLGLGYGDNAGTMPSLGQVLERWWHTTGDEERWDSDGLCPYAWAREIHELNCAFPVWPPELDEHPSALLSELAEEHGCSCSDEAHDEHHLNTAAEHDDMHANSSGTPRPHPDLLELDTPRYAGRIRKRWLVERLLAMAGIRLAGILNALVAGDESAHLSTSL
ncbi:phospholipase C/P1 nuclease [Wolfiporia cocos MD-104 SS10]|uniref:Phospholipase C/P1 nuclease n=1 Tax=Wolfiporia cocos (strain MD-104) TaxID=742152 RepID=A0A2H3K6Z1_WOLCO|nr:phospholipase C/P1 nuclease [Wolfiporia cocos MD-104 SS10]